MSASAPKVSRGHARAPGDVAGPNILEAGGIRFRLHPADNFTERCIWQNGRLPEKQSIDALASLIGGKRTLFFDIGANCGTYALCIGKASGRGSRILAFEPNPVLRERLQFNLSLNGVGNIEVFPCALGSRNGAAPLHFAGKRAVNLGEASLLDSGGAADAIDVEVRTLSSVVPQDAAGYEAIALKIDVEGYEDRVLLPFLRDADPEHYPDGIVIEVKHSHRWQGDLEGALANVGYRVSAEMEGNRLYARAR